MLKIPLRDGESVVIDQNLRLTLSKLNAFQNQYRLTGNQSRVILISRQL